MVKSGLIFIVCVFSLAYFSVITGYGQEQKAAESSRSTAGETEDKFTWDFGKVRGGGILKHLFVIKNESAAVLTIKGVTTTCGCTLSRVKKLILKPQESTLIEVKFNSKGYNGKVTQYVYVNTDNLDKPVIRYIIKADVVK